MSPEPEIRVRTYTVLFGSDVWPRPGLAYFSVDIASEYLVSGLLMRAIRDTKHDWKYVHPRLCDPRELNFLVIVSASSAIGAFQGSEADALMHELHRISFRGKFMGPIALVGTSLDTPGCYLDNTTRIEWAAGVHDSVSVANLRNRVCKFFTMCDERRMRELAKAELAAAEATETLEYETAVPGASNS